MQIVFLDKIRKISMSSAELAQRVVKVNQSRKSDGGSSDFEILLAFLQCCHCIELVVYKFCIVLV